MESLTAVINSISSKSLFKTYTQQIKLLDRLQGTIQEVLIRPLTHLDLKKLFSKLAMK